MKIRKCKYNFGNNNDGVFSTINGYATETNNFGETAVGILNKSTLDPDTFTSPDVVTSSKATLFSVGNGSDNVRKNAFEIKANGDTYINGVGGYDGTNSEDATSVGESIQSVQDSSNKAAEDIESIHIEKSGIGNTYVLKVAGEDRGTITDESGVSFTPGNGLQLVDTDLSVKIDSTSESYLTAGQDGLKISGIDAKFGDYLPLSGGTVKYLNIGDYLMRSNGLSYSNTFNITKIGISDFNNPILTIDANNEPSIKMYGSGNYTTIHLGYDNTGTNYGVKGVTISGKTSSDLLNAAGSTTPISSIATQVQAAIVDSAPETLDTLNELAAALNDDPNFAITITNQIAQKADKTVATTSSDGLMSSADKAKLDSVNISNYVTLDSTQTINGNKTFTNNIVANGFVIPNGTSSEVLTADGDSNTLKTINGQTLLGEGDIDLSGYVTTDNLGDYLKVPTLAETGSTDWKGWYQIVGKADQNNTFIGGLEYNPGYSQLKIYNTAKPSDSYVQISSYPNGVSIPSISLFNTTATTKSSGSIGLACVGNCTATINDNSGFNIRVQERISGVTRDSLIICPDGMGWASPETGAWGAYVQRMNNYIDKNGIKLDGKTSSDLLHAAGGTTTLKTINGESLLGSGDIALDAEHITVKDTLGYFSGNNVESALQEIAQPLDTHLQNMTSGLRHIPSGGAPNNILAWDSEGTAKWENLSNIEVSTDDLLAYGVQWDTTVSDPVLTRIGNTSLHKSLPIQSGMYGCICQGSIIRYRLDDEDWRFKRTPDAPITVSLTQEDDIITINDPIFATKQYEKQWIKINDIKIQIDSIDTETQTATLVPNEYTGTLHTGQYSCELGSVRNGYDGSVRVYVPGFYYKSTQTGNICQVLLSTSQIDSTYHYQQPVLIDAYRCTVLNTVPENMGWLSTLPVNTAVSIANVNSYCRGGNNNSSFDQYLENDPRRTQLGKPRTNLSRATMRGYAANNNSHLLTYEEYKNIFYWLYVVEYANFNSQATFSSSLDDNGYRTGGLGNGVTTMNYNVWVGYNSVCPLTPCGYLDSLGGNPGVEPQVLAAFDMTVTPTKNWGSWTTQIYRSGNNNLNRATMSKGNPTLTITHVDNVGQILYCRSDNVSGVATYTISGLQSGQELRFECSGQTTQTVTTDGQITMDWGTNGAQTRSLYANFTGDCNITVTCDSVVDSIVAEYPSQSITVNRWRGFDNPFGDIWTNLDGVIIDADADNHENSTDYVYVCTDPSKFSDTLTDDYIKIAESTHNEGYVKAFDLGDDANIIASAVGGGGTTYMCDYHWTGNANTTLRTLCVGGGAHNGAAAGFGFLYSYDGVSDANSYRGFRSVSVVSQ